MKKRLILLGTIALVTFFGCGEDYLEVEPSEFLSAEQVAEAAQDNQYVADALINGVYALMVQTGTGGTNLRHDDFGQKGYDIYTDMLSSDMALSSSSYGWYTYITQYQTTQDFTLISNYQPWRYYYRLIRSCNLIIDGNGGNDAVPDTELGKSVMGQAKAIRANSYFYLTQLFANSYDPSQPILPLYVDPAQQSLPKSTTSEVFELIVSDLTDAISLLENYQRDNKVKVDKHVAKGILAYVYAAMGDDTGVINMTNDVINEGGFPIMTQSEVLGGFNNATTPAWIWGIDITLDSGLDLVSWWGQIDLFTYSYAWAGDRKSIDSDLYAAIPANDVRKNQFDPSYALMPINKFYDADRVVGGQRFIESDYVFMRSAEMYLLAAEAYANMTDDINARARLKSVVQLRVPDASYIDALAGQALKDEIYLQSRIELWGEGKTYLALKRNQRSTTRGANHLSFVGETIQYNDERLTFEIPESEIQNNPNLNTQN